MLIRNYLLFSGLLLISIAILSCRNTQAVSSYRDQSKTIYIGQFKLTYLRQLLAKSYNNSNEVRQIIKLDNSGFTEPVLSTEDYRLIDSLTTMDNEYLKVDSAQGGQRAEGAQGKRPLGFILQKLESKWLDSLAERRWKQSDFKIE